MSAVTIPEDQTVYRLYLDGEITEKKARKVIEELHSASATDPGCTIEFVINSQGGCVFDGTAIYSELAAMSIRGGGEHFVITKVRGMCGSIATVIFQAGDLRVGGVLDILIFHEPIIYLHNEFLSSVKQRIRDMDIWENRFLDILMERAEAPRDVIAALTGPVDRVVGMEEAVRLGIADVAE